MNKEDYEFLLEDRIAKIRAINEQYDLEQNAYISFSGGKDSTVLHYLIDLALPDNKIPRVFINTGIEFKDLVSFVKKLSQSDDRIIILQPTNSIKQVLDTYGYPFKSKQHSHNLSIYQNSGMTITSLKYLGLDIRTRFLCPNILKYQFTPEYNLKCSDLCCSKLKKEPAHKWQVENNKTITLTGMRKEEGGQRANIGCIVTDKEGQLMKFHPLLIIDDEFENAFIAFNNIRLCCLYYSPFNFHRTGCKGCPFALDLQEQLDVMERLLPNEKKQCEYIWAPVYEEYRRLGYRLRKKGSYRQTTLDDYLDY